ncbi:MAG: hypothetical protein JNL08_20460 [Planctomycetes bacterium]|nr:hypothetical protein [Planctomycetota bacterium]
MTVVHCLPFWFVMLSITLPAQKEEATFEWAKRTAKIGYESLPVGQHSLDELKVGAPWRLGASHDASTLQSAMPILVGDRWIAPGAYRITLLRQDATKCVVVADGSHSALGGGEAVQIPGALGKTNKPAKRLAIELGKKGAAVAGNQPAQMVIRFGADEWRGDVLVLGNKTVSVTGGKLAVFTVPTTNLERGAVPIASLVLGKGVADAWNVVLDGDKVRLVPWMQAPKTLEAPVMAPDSAGIVEGTVAPVEATVTTEAEVLELREAALAKGELRLVVAFGAKVLECMLPEPKRGK